MIVFLIGKPGAGKTTASRKLAKAVPNIIVVHKDNYIENSRAIIQLLDNAKKNNQSVLVEGNYVFPILRYGVSKINPDAIFELNVPDELVYKVYFAERDPAKSAVALGYYKMERHDLDNVAKKYKLEIKPFSRADIVPELIDIFS